MGQKHSSHELRQGVEIAEDAVENISSDQQLNDKSTVATSEDDLLGFPFLQDESSIYYFKNSRIMIILRGLPGSGKTYLANQLQQKFKSCLEVCSADQYFEQNGTYRFDKTRLSDAHQYCRNKALSLCKKGKPIVVIDNTNVGIWEMEFYMDLAQKAGYVQLFVEPRTPWRYDPSALAAKNTHGIAYEVIERRASRWETLQPTYFGWFLNPCDSSNLYHLAAYYLECCMKVSKFKEEFQELIHSSNSVDIFDYFGISTSKSVLLHCTSKFCGGRQSSRSIQEYWNKAVISQSYGKTFVLEIVGLLITDKTFGARVKLNSDEIVLWDQDDYSRSSPQMNGDNVQRNSSNSSYRSPRYDTRPRGRGGRGRGHHSNHHRNNLPPFVPRVPSFEPPDPMLCCPTLRSTHEDRVRDRLKFFHPTEGTGSRAHMTLGSCWGVSAVQTGYDLVELVALETEAVKQNLSIPTHNIPGGSLRHYQEGCWMLYLEKPLIVDAVFAFHVSASQ